MITSVKCDKFIEYHRILSGYLVVEHPKDGQGIMFVTEVPSDGNSVIMLVTNTPKMIMVVNTLPQM